MGGTFDPVHSSHLELAEIAYDEFSLDKVLFIPSAVPPHKLVTRVTSFEHRVRMVEIACGSRINFECSKIEGEMARPSYTVDTIKALLAGMDREKILYFIVGSDAFLDILTWKSYKEILRLVSLLVSRRKGVDKAELSDLAATLAYDTTEKSVWSSRKGSKDIFFLKQNPAPLSSTRVKKYIRDELMLEKIIPEEVAEYIRENGLYSS